MFTYLKKGRFLPFLLTCALLGACEISGPKTAQDWFEVTWAGLAGSDTMNFQGRASLLRDNQIQEEGNIAFSGQLQNHQMLTLKAEPSQAGRGHNLAMAGLGKGAELATFQLKGRKWVMLDRTERSASPLPRTLNRINPLAQLEEIHDTKAKTIRLESGAARGTKVLRIELAPDEAKALLRRQLTEEMDNVLADWKLRAAGLALSRPELDALTRQVEDTWSKGRKEMTHKLDIAQVSSVYHLTIDNKSGLPKRLTSSSTVTYPANSGVNKPEVYMADCHFQ
ncbi:hypothetical protein [Paenibacillus tuaregi]|uniref:hypothetical protein n=1 Tax=Paenibacillus tuaregi TaxID=1816681 RepID=UPI0008395CA3|nr:hypothetical protein [Paenibacillus tuaregi]